MISIEEVTDAESEQEKPVPADVARAAEAAEARDQSAASPVDSPQTDANAEVEDLQVTGSTEQDTLVRVGLCRLHCSHTESVCSRMVV